MSLRETVGSIVENRRNDTESSFEWQIYDFISLTTNRGDRYGSPSFYFCNGLWSLAIHPNGTLRESRSGWVTLFLFQDKNGLPRTFNVTLGIRGVEGVENEKEREQEFSENDVGCCWFAFTTLSKLKLHQSRLMPNGMLIISCHMKSVEPPAVSDASSQTDEVLSEVEALTEENKSPEKLGIEKLSEDIGKLLVAAESADVTVQVDDTEFKVHKVILSARCPVLSAMFRHDTEERASNRISIGDCKPDVFGDFLCFMYSGSIKSLTERNVFDLYKLADKYLVDDLKHLCLKLIKDKLSVQTFPDTVKLALTHGEKELLQLAIDFAADNISLILCSVEWQQFIREYPTEANEILIKCFGPRS